VSDDDCTAKLTDLAELIGKPQYSARALGCQVQLAASHGYWRRAHVDRQRLLEDVERVRAATPDARMGDVAQALCVVMICGSLAMFCAGNINLAIADIKAAQLYGQHVSMFSGGVSNIYRECRRCCTYACACPQCPHPDAFVLVEAGFLSDAAALFERGMCLLFDHVL
jgi:hypothetical protein